MLKGIDHLVIVVRDLEAAIASFAQVGFNVVRGGKHPGGTHNALIAFADGSYVELIAFVNRDSAHPWNAALARGGGLVDFCLWSDDFTRDVESFRRAGAQMSDPMPLSRERPDGYRLSWVLSLPPYPYLGVIPFLIKDETARDERLPRERNHSNGALGIGRLSVAVADARAIGGIFASAIGRSGDDVEREDFSAKGVRFVVGPHEIEFLAPSGERGPLADWLGARGASPYAARLVAARGIDGELDSALTERARLYMTSV